jgi:protein-S-isoprenylcysteine O-methyltransferase Ste14
MSRSIHGHKENWSSSFRYILQRMTLFLVFAVLLFVAAGTLDWKQGWVYLIYTLLAEIATLIVLAKRAPGTLAQRGTQHAGVKGFDRVFAASWVALALVTPLVAGLDKRLAWSSMPGAALYGGAVLLAAGEAVGTWAMVENEHFEQFVRIQADRAHRVVTTGPYKIVRHPGYAGAVLGALATPLMLCSWWTLVPAGAVAVLFAVRTELEDRTLCKELEGYEAYSQRTRYRLLPGIW